MLDKLKKKNIRTKQINQTLKNICLCMACALVNDCNN